MYNILMNRKERTANILEQLLHRLQLESSTIYVTEFSPPLCMGRTDVFAWQQRHISRLPYTYTTYEIKSCWEDYAHDNKWRSYLDTCNKFYFVVDQDFPVDRLISELSNEKHVGIMCLDDSHNKGVRVIKTCRKKPLHNSVDITILNWMITRRLFYMQVFGGRD